MGGVLGSSFIHNFSRRKVVGVWEVALGAGDLVRLLAKQVGKGDFGTHLCWSLQAGNPRAWGMRESRERGFRGGPSHFVAIFERSSPPPLLGGSAKREVIGSHCLILTNKCTFSLRGQSWGLGLGHL